MNHVIWLTESNKTKTSFSNCQGSAKNPTFNFPCKTAKIMIFDEKDFYFLPRVSKILKRKSTVHYYNDQVQTAHSFTRNIVYSNENKYTKREIVGIKGSWFVNHKSISWSQKPTFLKTSIFQESFFPKYDNFKIISAGDICLSICLESHEWDWSMKEKKIRGKFWLVLNYTVIQ